MAIITSWGTEGIYFKYSGIITMQELYKSNVQKSSNSWEIEIFKTLKAAKHWIKS